MTNCIKISCAFSVIFLAGCAGRGDIIPDSGPKMIDIFTASSASETPSGNQGIPGSISEIELLCSELNKKSARRDCLKKARERNLVVGTNSQVEPVLYDDFTRSEVERNRVIFKRVPNPDVIVYVVPHLATSSEVPIPGYVTTFPMFNKVNYALPGEINMRDPVGRAALLTHERQNVFRDAQGEQYSEDHRKEHNGDISNGDGVE